MTNLDEILTSFASLAGDAIAIGFRGVDDGEAKLLWINNAYTDLFGYPADEVIGREASLVNDPAHLDAFIASVEPALEAGDQHIHSETYCRTKEGQSVWTSVMMFVVPVEGGHYSAAIWMP
ncbi:PAS domain-containing protein [Boseongicola aestuarii]|uniref:PAS domain-containing protein n=1 Tax=Boseongicola aestuarii TaxID=1470561 RepID=A0A238IY95_9RHOB|nr:PAS domain-containing protein [Boseongicola aestuarii]SMX23013.1 hypothetical protein BOA8489_01113 [Boseongicola aestuarii]